MNIDHLRYFLVLTQEMHYGRAAQRLNISQSGLSHAMAALEQELGAPLFQKSGRGIALGRYGAALLPQAQQIVNDRAQIVDTANAQAQAIVKKAEERARILVSDAEIVKAAQQRAAEITAAAQSESRTLRQTVTDYCDNMLKTTEEAMVENAAQVKNVRANLRQNAKKNG